MPRPADFNLVELEILVECAGVRRLGRFPPEVVLELNLGAAYLINKICDERPELWPLTEAIARAHSTLDVIRLDQGITDPWPVVEAILGLPGSAWARPLDWRSLVSRVLVELTPRPTCPEPSVN